MFIRSVFKKFWRCSEFLENSEIELLFQVLLQLGIFEAEPREWELVIARVY